MKVAVIGAGKMGGWFSKFFAEQGMQVVVSDKETQKLEKLAEMLNVEIADNVNAVKRADRILICVPIENFESVIAEIQQYIRPEQEVMDICSVKELPVNIMHRYIKDARILGTHPLFGPGVKNIKNQNFVLTPTNTREKRLAEEWGSWLRNKGAKVFIMSPTEHDKLMSIVLGLPYFLGLVVCDTLTGHNQFSQVKKVSGISFKLLMMLAEAVASEEAEFSASLQINLPEIEKVIELFREKVTYWLNLVRQKRRTDIIERVNLLKKELANLDPNYPDSYQNMHKIVEALYDEKRNL
ncbi:MAG: prephenate dehydrogenase/arogenate dehydrogenase family protein [Candidatus Bathyarchaeia archaeon]